MNINWEDSTLRFDPISPDPFATHGIPLPAYGNYGRIGLPAKSGTSADPPPVDPLDALFYTHDLAYQTSTNPATRALADITFVEGMHGLTFTDPGQRPRGRSV